MYRGVFPYGTYEVSVHSNSRPASLFRPGVGVPGSVVSARPAPAAVASVLAHDATYLNNPEGIESVSPGLARLRAYPGAGHRIGTNPNGVASRSADAGCNPVGVDGNFVGLTQGSPAVTGQPWAGRWNPVGILRASAGVTSAATRRRATSLPSIRSPSP